MGASPERRRSETPVAPETTERPPLYLVRPTSVEQVDRRQQRLAFTQRCEDIAIRLARSSMRERLAAYRSGEYSGRELSTATALRPDLMPVLNGEWEWIAVTAADLD
jgi:hypothetical protein